MTGIRLTSITLEGFRGFAREQKIGLDADAVLVRGANGTGKTSLTDGFLWLICAELAYLDERVDKLRRGEDSIVSRYTETARVSLELTAGEDRFTFSRVGTQKDHALSATRNGREQRDPEQLMTEVFGHATLQALRSSVTTWGILRQDAVRATLGAGKALHERLAAIVGLQRVSSFATATSEAARALVTQRTAAKRAIADVERQHHAALEREQKARAEAPTSHIDVRGSLIRLAEALPPGLAYDAPEAADVAAVEALGRALGPIRDALRALRDLRAQDERVAATQIPSVETAEREVARAQEHLEAANVRGPAAVRLAEAALALLTDDTCPVCGQTVDQASLTEHLRETVAASGRLLSAVQEASDALASASSRLSGARVALEQNQRVASETKEAHRALREAVAGALGMRLTDELPDDAAALGAAVERVDRALEESRVLWRSLRQASGAQLDQLAAETRALELQLNALNEELAELKTTYDSAKALERSSHAAAERIVADALTKLQPSFAEVFDRLNPNPAFTELRSKQDVLRNVNQVVPMVRDPLREVEANPLLVFSEGQVNVVAISYFLGMALNAHDATLPFLILDDPLQALDTISVLGFGDLCRRLRGKRQLIVTTHDRRYADILTRKLSPREAGSSTIVHEFDGWTREGPAIDTVVPELAEIVPLLPRSSGLANAG